MIARRTRSVKTEAASDFTSPRLGEQQKKARTDGARKGREAIRAEQAAACAACPPHLLARLNDPQTHPMTRLGQAALRNIFREAIAFGEGVHRASWAAPAVVDTMSRWRTTLEKHDRRMRELNIAGYEEVTEVRNWLDDLPPQQTLKWLRCCRLYPCQRFFFDETLGGVRRYCSPTHPKRHQRQKISFTPVLLPLSVEGDRQVSARLGRRDGMGRGYASAGSCGMSKDGYT
jgi:hypothetical protein